MKKKKFTKNSLPKNIKKIFLNMSNLQIILLTYLFVTITVALLLLIPAAQQPGQNITFIDTLFTAASAFSDTGLTTVPTVIAWTDFGQFLIALLILLGGIGIFALKVWIINIVFRIPISITSKNILEKERGSSNSGELKKTIKISITFLFVVILIATLVLWMIFYFEQGEFTWINGDGEFKDFSKYDPKGNALVSFKYAIFHSISAINNAGFDILSDSSLKPYYSVYSIQIVFIILLVIGGIGFPVIYDCLKYISHKFRRRTDFSFSLFSKVTTISYLITFIIGLSFTFIFESVNKYDGILQNDEAGSASDKVMAIFFHVFSTRNAGFTTLDSSVVKFSDPTLIIFSIMMFIGSSPSSTAGGIRTTTLAILVVSIWNRMRGIKDVRMFKRKINVDAVHSSFIVFFISIMIVLTSTLICFTSIDSIWGTADRNSIKFADIFYEVCSAYGTTGLSTGLTPDLNILSKLTLILVMFIGQLGISSTMLVWRKNNYKNNYSYIEEDILVG